MPRIPTIQSEVAARVGRSTAGVPSPQANADAFGAAQARGLQAFGQGLGDLSQGLSVAAERKRNEDVALRVAGADFTPRELAIRNEVGPDANGYRDRTLEEYDKFVDEEANKIEDDKTRAAFRQRMAVRRNEISSRSATYEFGTAADYADQQINTALVSLDNRVRLQPDQFEDLLSQGIDVIGASSRIPETAKAGAKVGWTQKATRSYFEGRLDSAQDAEDIDQIVKDLGDEKYSSRLSSEGLDNLLNTAKSARSAILTKADADARAAVEFLEGRATDITTLIPQEEIVAAQELVAKSANPITQSRMARIARDQEIVREARKLPPAVQREVIESQTEAANVTGLPPRLGAAVMDASGLFGVSTTYMAGMVGREYGGYLKGNPDAIDYTQGNIAGASSAKGVAQIIDGTMLELSRDAGVRAVMASKGVDLAAMDDTAILALRDSPEASLIFAAAYAAKNANALRGVLGREPTDGELYIAHFMGGGGAVRLMTMIRANPTTLAADMFPDGAKKNPTIFYKKDGTARTVQELYNVLGASFGGTSSYVAAGDAATRASVLSATEKGVKNDPMGFAASVGVATLSDLTTPEGIAQRGSEARKVADYYNIPYSDMKPLQPDEAAALGKRMSDGTADDVLDILTSVQAMGGKMATAAMKQISDMNPVYGFAGGLAADGGKADTAGEIVRGQKRIEENPEVMKTLGVTENDLNTAFMTATGNSLFDVSPRERSAIQAAALAHYVETVVARGGAGAFNEDAYAASVNAVLGADKGGAVIDEVNGEKTVLPPGVDGDLVETAFEAMSVADWVRLSDARLPPRYANGEIADPKDLADEASLRAMGGGKYRVMMDDGTFLITGRVNDAGRPEAFVIGMTKDDLDRIIQNKYRNDNWGAVPSSSVGVDNPGDRPQTSVPNNAKNRQSDIQTTPLPQIDGQGSQPSDTPESVQQGDIRRAMTDGVITPEEAAALIAKYGEMWAYDSQGNRVVP